MVAAVCNRGKIALRARLASAEGVTVVEVIVAALILVLGALATLGLVDTAHRQTFRAEQSQVVSDRLQAEMEAVKRLEYTKVALTTEPSQSADSANPNYRVTNGSGFSTFALNENGTDSATLVVNGSDSVTGGIVDPGPTPFTSGDLGVGAAGDIKGQIYRYVTWINDPDCPDTVCPGAKDFKRVTIVIKVDDTAAGGARAYQQIQSDVVDGGIAQVPGGVAPPPSPSEAVPYSLSDTPCSASSRAVPSNHLTHNTLGPCSAGVQTGSTPGAPDRLFKSPVPNTGAFTGGFDFSTDVVTQASADEGLQMPVQPKQCDYSPSRSDAHFQVHRWLTAPVTGSSDFVVDGVATLTLYSKTINDAIHTGRLCVWLFTREPTNTGGEADNLVTDATAGSTYFTYSSGASNWNSGTDWGEPYQIPLTFQELRVEPGQRLGLALAVDAAGTPGEALQFRYDHPDFESVLQVYSTTKATAPN
jgi:Tfp pilus assembly protein PilV